MAIDVSVVVPVYNTEPFLHQCVDSLLAQTLKTTEFIFVDDGSTDRSLEILENYQRQDDRIRIIRQKNQFAGVARNKGMDAATGKYIIFLDSDDFFEPTMLEEAFECAEKNEAQIVVFNFAWYDNESSVSKENHPFDLPEGVFGADQAGEKLFFRVYAAPWNKLFLRTYIDTLDIHFQPVKKSNDTYFTFSAVALADRIVCLQRYLVHYRINNPLSLQGNTAAEFGAFVEPLYTVKCELKKRGRFAGSIKDAYLYYSRDIVRNYLGEAEAGSENLMLFYDKVKPQLLPCIFDSLDDFVGDSEIMRLYRSINVTDYLLQRLKEKESRIKDLDEIIISIYNSTISTKSMDYRIGHSILLVPRKILSWLKRKRDAVRGQSI